MLAFLPELIKGLPWLAALFCFSMWQWDRATIAETATAQEAAINAAQAKADALGAQLTAAEAKAAAITQQTVTKYVTQIQSAPNDDAGDIAASNGVRAIIGGSVPKSTASPPAGVPRSSTGSGPQ